MTTIFFYKIEFSTEKFLNCYSNEFYYFEDFSFYFFKFNGLSRLFLNCNGFSRAFLECNGFYLWIIFMRILFIITNENLKLIFKIWRKHLKRLIMTIIIKTNNNFTFRSRFRFPFQIFISTKQCVIKFLRGWELTIILKAKARW